MLWQCVISTSPVVSQFKFLYLHNPAIFHSTPREAGASVNHPTQISCQPALFYTNAGQLEQKTNLPALVLEYLQQARPNAVQGSAVTLKLTGGNLRDNSAAGPDFSHLVECRPAWLRYELSDRDRLTTGGNIPHKAKTIPIYKSKFQIM